MATTKRIISAMLISSGCVLLACSHVRNARLQEQLRARAPTLVQCEISHNAHDIINIGTQLLLTDYSRKTHYEAVEARLIVARFCFARALALSPNNYGATLATGVASLVAAKAALYYNRGPELAAEHLAQAKALLGSAYMLRAGQLEPLYYLAEVAVLEDEIDLALWFLSPLELASHKPLDVMILKSRVLEIQAKGIHATRRKYKKKPLVSMPALRNQHVGGGKRFRIGLLSFGDSPSGRALPAMLLSELQKTGRFQVFEGGGIRVNGQEDAPLTEATADGLVDGYLSGTIAKVSGNEVCFETRLSNALSHHVLYARPVCAPLEKRSDEVVAPKREKLEALAQDIARSIKEIRAGTITGVDNAVVYIDTGTTSGVLPGMVGYVLGTGSSVKDESITESVVAYTGVKETLESIRASANDFIVGGVYIISVEEGSCTGIFYREGVPVEEQKTPYAIPGDTVYFK